MKKLLMLFVGLMTTITFGQTILSENFGTPAASTAMATYTGYQSTSPITFAGTGTIRSTSASSGYTGASAGGNAYLGSTGTANQYLQINITTEMNSTKIVQVYDMIGQQVINTQIENQLNVSNLTPGMYIARITEEGKTATTKLVIQ
jgi:outer membrane receptor for monomeric catechols